MGLPGRWAVVWCGRTVRLCGCPVILAGGLGTRLAEETDVRPKPMVEVGHRPILWHIMKHYAAAGHREFVIALGYKGEESSDSSPSS